MVALSTFEFRPAQRPSDRRSSHVIVREASPRAPGRLGTLPVEISFLASYGVSVADLIEATASARQLGVSPLAALLSGGAVSDLTYYSILARRLGVPFVASPSALMEQLSSSAPAGAPIARLSREGRYLIAPEGEGLRSLLALWKDGRAPTDRLAITTPRRLAAWTRTTDARAVARAACDDLRRFDPALSAATPLGYRFGVVLSGLALLGLSVLFGAFAWIALCLLLGIVAAASIGVRLFAAAATIDDEPRRAPVLPDAMLPSYTIIVPLYREAAVVARLATGLAALDYPVSKIEVKFVVESDDHQTRAAIEALDLPERYETVVAPEGAPRTKPRALNVALATARGELVVVFDAEDAPERDQLRAAAERFAVADQTLACLQARLAIDNTGDGWLAALFGIEYAALFDVFNPGLAAFGAPMLLGGTSNHFRGIR